MMNKQQALDRYEEIYQKLNKTVESTRLQVELISSKSRNATAYEIDKANAVINGNKNVATMLLGMVAITNRQCKILNIDIQTAGQLECSKVEVVDEEGKDND